MLFAALAGLALTALPLGGDATCPSPAQVQRRLAGSSVESVEGAAARIESAGRGRVRVTLTDASGKVVASRKLRVRGSCQQMASTVAVLVEVWSARLSAGEVGPFPEPPEVAEVIEPEPPPAPPLPAAPVRWWTFRAAVGATASIQEATPAVGALLSFSLSSRDGGPGGLVELSGGSWRQSGLGPGLVQWQRFYVKAAPLFELAYDWGRLELSLGPKLAQVTIEGVGFSRNQTVSFFDFGLEGAAKATRSWGRFGVFAQAGVCLWPVEHTAFVAGLPQAIVFGWNEVGLSVGAVYSL